MCGFSRGDAPLTFFNLKNVYTVDHAPITQAEEVP